MKRVVYLLGAGFSAPLGIPVMSNFLDHARDQYEADQLTYGHFSTVLNTIREMHVCKSYYQTDLFNIEEILSILEMKGHVAGVETKADFLQFIRDVIEHHTPYLEEAQYGLNWRQNVFGPEVWQGYGTFCAAVLGYTFKRDSKVGVEHQSSYKGEDRQNLPSVEYSVITVNYDLVLETMVAFLRERFKFKGQFSVNKLPQSTLREVPLAKLHGSIDKDNLVPPTWNKSLVSQDIADAWQLAYKLLTGAHEIRMIGYSLPISDTYVRYLLRAAIIDTANLKRIDVLCLDSDGTVKRRYDEFVTFHNYRFKNDGTRGYLNNLSGMYGQWTDLADFKEVEQMHDNYFFTPRSPGVTIPKG